MDKITVAPNKGMTDKSVNRMMTKMIIQTNAISIEYLLFFTKRSAP